MNAMKGEDNIGFQSEESSEGKAGNGVEMKEVTPNDDVLVKLSENNKPETENEEKSNADKPNGIVRIILLIRSKLANLLFEQSPLSKFLWTILINGVAVALLAGSIVEYMKNGSPEIDWCDGVGFLWILYILVYFGVIFSLIKRFFGKSIKKFWKPVENLFASLVSNKYFRWLCYTTPVLALAIYVIVFPGKSGRRVFSFLGMIVFVLFGFIFSKHPGHISWRPVISGMVLQFVFGLLAIRWEVGKNILECLGNKITAFLQHTEAGSTFIYGFLSLPQPDGSLVFAFAVLPVVFFLSFFVNILSYYGALQWFILKISWVVKIFMGTTVCESVNAASSIFLGMTESPLLIQKYMKDLTKSEICAIMCAGWSTVAGVVLAAYIQFGVKASHLIAASVMSAPASLSFSKLFYPETEKSKNTLDTIVLTREQGTNALDAASKGALTAVAIVAGITANIVAFLAFVAFLDSLLAWIGVTIGFELSFKYVLSKLFFPVTFLMGIEEESMEDVAYLVGIKTVANEFQAYKILGEMITNNKLSERSEVIATYALCGFSNFGSIGITVGALSVIEPLQRSNVAQVALHAFIAANIVCFLTACVAGCLID